MKRLLLLIFVLLTTGSFAQTFTLKGLVTSAKDGQPLTGVTVVVKGTTRGSITDVEGKYSINIKNGDIVTFSFIGMDTKSIPVASNQKVLNVSLTENIQHIDEVVVVGYGTQKKSVISGAITSVKAADLESMPISRIEQALQGRTSGLTIASSSGQPGASSTVRVRGTTSINGSDPLYVVDGVLIDVGGIDYLNQSDIESIEVLKDAASAAIYGTKAASGVILITTKKGKNSGLSVDYNAYYGTQAPARKLDLLNATQYATLRNESSLAAGGSILFPNPQSLGAGTDWQGTIFNNNAKIQNHEVSISGGNDKSTYYSSFGYFKQDGIVATAISNYERISLRFNSSHKVKNWLTFGNNLAYSYIKSQGGLGTNTEFGGPLSSAINLDPITPIVITDPTVAGSNPYSTNPVYRDANGNPYGISKYVGQEMTNPLAYIKTQDGNYGWSHNMVGNVFAEIEPIKGLKLRSSIGAKLAFYGGESFGQLFYLSATQSNLTNTSFSRNTNYGLLWNWDNTASYSRSFDKHNLSIMAGTGAQSNSATGLSGTYLGLPVSSFSQASMNYSLPTANRIAGGWENQPYKLSSYFGRLTYDYAGKYLFTGILRIDGSSRFGSNNKYGKFPSVSIGWNPYLEDFWPKNEIINTLKVRGSYGVNGSDNIGDFAFVSTIGGGRNYVFGNNGVVIGYSPNAPANPDLKWEQTVQTNIGFDATIFNNFSLTFDVYKKKTSGMLLQVQLPLYIGASGQPWGNIADMENKGIELELGYHGKVEGVKIDLKANGSYLQNKVTYLGADKDFLTGANFQASAYEISRTAVGQPIGSFYGFETMGLFQTPADVANYKSSTGKVIQPNAKPGDFKYKDLNGDGAITSADRTYIGNPTPDFSFGFTANVSWKNFDLMFFGQGVAGNKIFQGLRRLDILTANYSTAALGRWTGPGTSNSFPRLTDSDVNGNFTNPSSFYLEDGSYFRIKTLQLGYTISNQIIKKVGLQKARIYVSSNNLATFTKYTGYDPEIGGGSYGIDRGIYPQARSFMVGVNVTF
ncbi:MAG: TonB-dependent receptor [Bacteroidetes bacterium]|nr:TonB-dependent receptor [Bacteroidota bacterium]